VWPTIHISFNLTPPTSVHNIFTDWLHGFHRKLKSKILVGASAICWVIWLTRNDVVFTKVLAPSYLQVIFREDLLDQVLVPTLEGGGSPNDEDRMQEKLRQPQWRCLQETVGD
jgi:hypothetical protein